MAKFKAFEILHRGNSKNIIIFIHGFTGTNDTWQFQDGSTPFIDKLLESPVISEYYDIILFKYSSDIIGRQKPKNLIAKIFSEVLRKSINKQPKYNLTVDKIANLLKTHLDIYIRSGKTDDVNICLVAHSMGGIVAKEFICKNIDYNIHQFHSINVPHKGSDLAIIRDLLGKNIQATDLMPNSDTLYRLEKEWANINNINKLPITNYYVGYSDNTVDSNAAIASENRSENQEYKIIYHDGGHSEFLKEKDNNIILETIKFELETHIHDQLKREANILEKEIQDNFLYLERISEECKESACLYSSSEIINKIVEEVCVLNYSIQGYDKDRLANEVEFILNTLRLCFLKPELITEFNKLKAFKYDTTYKYVFLYIRKNILSNCNCNTIKSFDKLIIEIKELF